MFRNGLQPTFILCVISLIAAVSATAQTKPSLTLDTFFNSVSFSSVAVSPDGHEVVLQTDRPDWKANRFREDLWLYRTNDGSLIPLSTSGEDNDPEWSPDGQWIAFVSDRHGAADHDSEGKAQIYAISIHGGEPFPVTAATESVHAFTWSADSKQIFFATREPQTDDQKKKHEEEWKDTIQYRERERGGDIFAIDFEAAARWHRETHSDDAKPPEARKISSSPYRVQQLAASHDGRMLAFSTSSRSLREESLGDNGIYTILLQNTGHAEVTPVAALRDPQAFFDRIQWARDSQHLFFSFLNGSVDGPYKDAQARVYWVRVDGNTSESCATNASKEGCARWARSFSGSIGGFTVLSDGSLIATGQLGTEVQPYVQHGPDSEFEKLEGQPGWYQSLSTASHGTAVAFVYSSLQSPAEVYLAEDSSKIGEAHKITSFNQTLSQAELPQGMPFRWTADDGVTVEGMLIYPPGKFGQKNLPMFTFIHGGPEDADGNHFEADWYQWADLAATDGWLVFEPNYRGSIGYGDAFALGIVPHIVSRPGKDILEGVDALVKNGIADASHLSIGGYSYGGYMTNWLITQTTRFKAAVTGAGAVEHVANWGNDDTTFDDAYFLGGLPWKTEENYNAEAAIWQIGKVRTPTHMVGGADDIRVYVGEDYLLERALHTMGIPSALLIFPGEGHSLASNPWHGKIKVREELKWLDQYGRK